MKFYKKYIMKFGEKSAILSKRNLKVNLYTMKSIYQNLIMEKSTQVFRITNYQKKDLNVFVYQ